MKTTMLATAAALCAAVAQGAAMCKMPSCKEQAIERSQFCERHTCGVKGCFAGVKIGGIPNWVEGSTKNAFAIGGGDSDMPTKIVWRHCPKHACGRMLPRLKHPNTANIIRGKSQDEALEILACGQERLFKGKYCLRHSCGVSKCASAVAEEWADRFKKDTETPPRADDLTVREFCPRHLATKGNEKYKREGLTKETCSENYDRKLAEKEAKLAEQKAKQEEQRAKMAEQKAKKAAEKAAASEQ